MSRLEILMYAVLALAVIVLVALFVARIVWASSRRIHYWRERRNQPDEVASLRAERDQLKAEHAMLARRLELRLRELQERFVRQEADVSRARNRVGVLVEKLDAAAKVIEERDAQIATLKEMAAALEADLEKRTRALHDLKDALRSEKDKSAQLETEARALAAKLADRERQLAILREEISMSASADAALASSGSLADVTASGAALDAQERLARKIEELNKMARQLESQRAELLKPKETLLDRVRPDLPAAEAVHREAPEAAGKDEKGPGKAQAGARDGKQRGKKAKGKNGRDKKGKQETGGESRALARKMMVTEDVSQQLSKELEDLDELWQSKLDSLKVIDKALETGPKANGKKAAKAVRKPRKIKKTPVSFPGKALKTAAGKTGGEDKGKKGPNVVSLAARIRALKEQTR